MVNTSKVGAALSTKEQPQSLEMFIKKAGKEIGKSLPTALRPERFVQIALTCLRLNPQLTKCTPASLIGALFVSAQLGLEPVAGNAYILPFNNSKNIGGQWVKVLEAQFLIGYKGLATLFYRHEKAVQMNWGAVHEKDDFSYQYGTDQFLKHIPAKEGGKVIGYYVVAVLQNGGKSFMYMTKEDCLAHGKKHSKTFSKKDNKFLPQSPWTTNPDAMCLKTVLIQLAKLLPLSIEVQQAISADETSREYREGIDNALDLPDQTTWDEKAIEEQKGEPTPEELATLKQCQKLHILLDELKLSEEDFYKQVNTHYTININSTKSLTKTQASEVIEELQQQADKIAQEGKKEGSSPKFTCYDCAEEGEQVSITEAEAKFSTEHYGRKLCRTHQQKEKDKNA